MDFVRNQPELGPGGVEQLISEREPQRCAWAGSDVEYRRYHDEEWGVPLHGDRALFEKLSLEGFQAGLSWLTILRRRERLRRAFSNFEPAVVAEYTTDDVARLLADSGIIRNRAKIAATISNAQVTVEFIGGDPGALDRLIWGYRPDRRPEADRPRSGAELAAHTVESTALSAELHRRGYRFVGPTTVYALMQSAGLVDDHVRGCWRAAP